MTKKQDKIEYNEALSELSDLLSENLTTKDFFRAMTLLGEIEELIRK